MALLKYDLVDQIIRVAKIYAAEEEARLNLIEEEDAAQAAEAANEAESSEPNEPRDY